MKSGLKQKLTCVALASAFGLAASMPSFAASDAKEHPTASKASADAKQTGRDVRASKIIGKNVENAQGENLGEIKDLIVDVGSQRVHYAVLEGGGTLGMGDKLFAYPISAFKSQSDSDKLVLNVDKDRLKKAPGFDKDKWPDWNDNRYRGEVDRYFKSDTAKAVPRSARMVRASELVGKNVNDRAGKDAGEIEDVVVNMSSGRVSYAVLDFDKAWSPDDKLLPMPLTAFTFPTDKKKDIVLNLARNQIDMKTGFDEKDWPDLNAAEFRRDVRAHLASIERGAHRTARAAHDGMTSSGR
ncbi:PRC-barrel domain-containing protein [Noviherbaspirillum sp. ST9]|uniref:PRC-barrel domain-containing protein n=1 Tax=Noviherbaspirillum sp. ST9 TaxID=3401606 RepID=UPI003B586DF8